MTGTHILAIDQGTTNTKAILVDRDGSVVSRASRPLSIRFPQPAWVEQSAEDLWRSVADAVDECLERAGDPKLAAIGISNQRESAILWDRKTGAPAGPCAVWQCRRSAGLCARLRERGLEPLLRARSGLPLDPLFSAGKIRWLLDQLPVGAAEDVCAGTVDAWLLWNLTAGKVHACDVTNASRTQLFNLRRLEWDPDLLAAFDVPRAVLPEVRPSSGYFGASAATGRLPAGVPVMSLIGDSHAALFAHRAFHPGAVKATYGTGSSLMTPTAAPVESRTGLSTTIAWGACGQVQYALEGNISVTGSAVQWIGEFFGFEEPAARAAQLAEQAADNGGVYLVPAFVGLGAPYWDDAARGLITGITRATSAAQVARATLESIAYQVRDVFDAMAADASARLSELLADGGATRNAALMQFQADILGKPVVRSESTDLSPLGAAWLAGLAAGAWPSFEALERLPAPVTRFEPAMSAGEREACYRGWREAVDRALYRPPARIGNAALPRGGGK